MTTLKDAGILIKIARSSIKGETFSGKIPKCLKTKKGVFVTLFSYPSGILRGCIGIIEPTYSLVEAVQKAAYSAAYEDTRFYPVKKDELDKITIEISILSKPKPTNVSKIKKGDGVIIKRDNISALFLPQVWEQLPEKEQFLDALCNKAGMFPKCWLGKNVITFKFKVVAFKEKTPYGEVFKETI